MGHRKRAHITLSDKRYPDQNETNNHLFFNSLIVSINSKPSTNDSSPKIPSLKLRVFAFPPRLHAHALDVLVQTLRTASRGKVRATVDDERGPGNCGQTTIDFRSQPQMRPNAARHPPSLAASEAKYRVASSISLIVPMDFSGILLTSASFWAGGRRRAMPSVSSMGPGETNNWVRLGP